jgi:hypothetical protein
MCYVFKVFKVKAWWGCQWFIQNTCNKRNWHFKDRQCEVFFLFVFTAPCYLIGFFWGYQVSLICSSPKTSFFSLYTLLLWQKLILCCIFVRANRQYDVSRVFLGLSRQIMWQYSAVTPAISRVDMRSGAFQHSISGAPRHVLVTLTLKFSYQGSRTLPSVGKTECPTKESRSYFCILEVWWFFAPLGLRGPYRRHHPPLLVSHLDENSLSDDI